MPHDDRMADGQDKPWFLYIMECSDGSFYSSSITTEPLRVTPAAAGLLNYATRKIAAPARRP